MDGLTILSSLKQMCRDIDAGRPLRRISLGRAFAPAIIGFSLVAGGCPNQPSPAVGVYGAPPMPAVTEICTDGVDNDGDGRLDCADEQCSDAIACQAVQEYAAPFPGVAPEAPDENDAQEAVTMYGRPFEQQPDSPRGE